MKVHCLLPLLLVSAFTATGALAQGYPNKPIRIITSGAGGGQDFVARLLAAEITGPLGQPVIVENRAAGFTMNQGVAKAAPDGYTLLITGGALWIAPQLTEAPYDVLRDFAPVGILTNSPNFVVVTAGLPVKTVADLVKLVKAKSGELNYTSGSIGSGSHLGGELFKSMVGADIVRIAYKEQSQETSDLVSGKVQMTFGSGASWMTLVKAGKLRALATGGLRRSIMAPDLPTVAETLPGYVSEQIVALFATGKTPDAVIRRLNQESVRALEKPDLREKLLNSGVEVAGGSPEQLAETMKSELARLSKILAAVRAAGS